MTDEKRAALAYLSGVLLIPDNRRYYSVYDYNRQMYVSLSCNKNGNYLSNSFFCRE